ncbi:hypothetical protein Tco_0040184 [Tanacetum coccineum]
MLCYLTGMEPYYIQCIKDGPFRPKMDEGATKPESHERRLVNQDQRLKSIIISCLPDDIIESVISCEIVKATWTDLVHNFEGPSMLVPSRFVIFDLEPLSLSFDFVFCSEIFKYFLLCLFCLCHLAILGLDQHAHTLHHHESLITISLDNLSLDNLDIFKEDFEYQSLRKSLYLILELS